MIKEHTKSGRTRIDYEELKSLLIQSKQLLDQRNKEWDQVAEARMHLDLALGAALGDIKDRHINDALLALGALGAS